VGRAAWERRSAPRRKKVVSYKPQVPRDGWGICGGRGAPRRDGRKLQVSSSKSQGRSCKSQAPSCKLQVRSRREWLGCSLREGRAGWEGRFAPRRKKAASLKFQVASEEVQAAGCNLLGVAGVFLVRGALGGRGASRRDSLFLRGSVAPQSGPPTGIPQGIGLCANILKARFGSGHRD
jgi:hypothetical protein